MTPLVDTGARLAHRAFERDLHTVLERARAAGVEGIVALSGGLRTSRASAEMAARHRGYVLATVGFDPAQTRSATERKMEELRRLLGGPGVVGIGVCGLDHERDTAPRPVQRHWFERQADLAAEAGALLFVQDRGATAEVLEVVRPRRDRLAGVVVHGFGGDREALARWIELDAHVGVCGLLFDAARGGALREALRRIPADRVVLESHAPFLLPRTLRPRPKRRRNEPAFLGHLARAFALLLGEREEAVAERSAENARSLLLRAAGLVRARGA